MKQVLYEDANKELYLEDGDFFVKTQYPYNIYEISYRTFIEEIEAMWQYSEAWKRLKIIEAGKAAGILSEVA